MRCACVRGQTTMAMLSARSTKLLFIKEKMSTKTLCLFLHRNEAFPTRRQQERKKGDRRGLSGPTVHAIQVWDAGTHTRIDHESITNIANSFFRDDKAFTHLTTGTILHGLSHKSVVVVAVVAEFLLDRGRDRGRRIAIHVVGETAAPRPSNELAPAIKHQPGRLLRPMSSLPPPDPPAVPLSSPPQQQAEPPPYVPQPYTLQYYRPSPPQHEFQPKYSQPQPQSSSYQPQVYQPQWYQPSPELQQMRTLPQSLHYTIPQLQQPLSQYRYYNETQQQQHAYNVAPQVPSMINGSSSTAALTSTMTMAPITSGDSTDAAHSSAVAVTECVVCQDLPASHATVPCGHRCLCDGCAAILVALPGPAAKCPMCRTLVQRTLKIYL
jgi:hypothetical protein